MTFAIYLAHLNPVTNAHVEIIDELKKESKVIVMPVIFLQNKKEVNSRSFPFSFEIRKQMLEAEFGDTITISSNYTFNAPFCRYLPPLLSPASWQLRKQILQGIEEAAGELESSFFTKEIKNGSHTVLPFSLGRGCRCRRGGRLRSRWRSDRFTVHVRHKVHQLHLLNEQVKVDLRQRHHHRVGHFV